MTREHLPNRRSIEDAARLVGGERDDDTGPGYIAPPPLFRRDWVSWVLLISLLVGAAVGIWGGVS